MRPRQTPPVTAPFRFAAGSFVLWAGANGAAQAGYLTARVEPTGTLTGTAVALHQSGLSGPRQGGGEELPGMAELAATLQNLAEVNRVEEHQLETETYSAVQLSSVRNPTNPTIRRLLAS